MELSLIESIIISVAPAVTAILGIVAVALKILSRFKELKKQVDKATDTQELKAALAQAHQENLELKKQVNKLINKIDKIYVPQSKQ